MYSNGGSFTVMAVSLLKERVVFKHLTILFQILENSKSVRRGINEIFSGSKSVKINQGADIVLETSYLLCEDGNASLTLINPNESNLEAYQIEWSDGNGEIVGYGNTISVDKPGKYTANFFRLSQEVNQTCQQSFETIVNEPKDYSITINNSSVCNSGTDIIVTASPGVFGKWYYQKVGLSEKVLLGDGNNLTFRRAELDGAGDYNIVFEVDNSDGNTVSPGIYPADIDQYAKFPILF